MNFQNKYLHIVCFLLCIHKYVNWESKYFLRFVKCSPQLFEAWIKIKKYPKIFPEKYLWNAPHSFWVGQELDYWKQRLWSIVAFRSGLWTEIQGHSRNIIKTIVVIIITIVIVTTTITIIIVNSWTSGVNQHFGNIRSLVEWLDWMSLALLWGAKEGRPVFYPEMRTIRRL